MKNEYPISNPSVMKKEKYTGQARNDEG